MNLYLLEEITSPRNGARYDTADAFVIRARSYKAAREIAAKNCGDEGPDHWRDPAYTTCSFLTRDGEEGVILRDFSNG